MAKEFQFANLLSLYKSLLTPYQQNVACEYYFCDLSMGEIAQNYSTSRQCINDCLASVRKKLISFEEKLQLEQKLSNIETTVNDSILFNKILEIIKEN